MAVRDALDYAQTDRVWLEDYLPKHNVPANTGASTRPWVTLTYATSLDSALAIAPGQQTALSGPQSKAMTHFLRSRHDAILVGVNTAVVDDPSLNCRLRGVGGYGGEALDGQPKPIVLDPTCRWSVEDSKILKLAQRGMGRAPLVFCLQTPPSARRHALEAAGGAYLQLREMNWVAMLEHLQSHGLRSVMIEGGSKVITDLLSPSHQDLIDSVIITLAPTWLGRAAVKVEPDRLDAGMSHRSPVGRLQQTKWQQLGNDVVLCGTFTS